MLYHCFNAHCDLIIGAKTTEELFWKIDEHIHPFDVFIRQIKGKDINIMLAREVLEHDDFGDEIFGYDEPAIGESMYDAMAYNTNDVRVFDTGYGSYKLVKPKNKFLTTCEEM